MRRTLHRPVVGILCAGLVVIALPGCLGGGRDDPGPSVPSPPADAKVVSVDWLNETPKGRVVYCTDPSPARKHAVQRFNDTFAQRGLSVTLQELPSDSREQRQQFLDGSSCDVYDSDVIWMAEWAARGRVYNMLPYIQRVEDERGRGFIPTTLKTAEFAGSYWGVPHTTNAGVLFYRTDGGLSRADRDTWQHVYRSAKTKGHIDYQGTTPEPLTVNFLEVAFAAGGRVLSRDGRRSVIDSAENLDALRLMVDGIRTRAASKAVLGHDEKASLATFVQGKATFMRNWPDKFSQLADTPIAQRYDMAPLPIFDGAGVAGVLGGADLVIDAEAANPRGALAFIDFLIRPQQQKWGLIHDLEPAVLETTYQDKAVQASVPFAAKLERAIRQGRPRPVSPAYDEISKAISSNVRDALTDSNVSPEQALGKANAEIDAALASAAEG
jgi:multiple sugar transport system substrate-binding protein